MNTQSTSRVLTGLVIIVIGLALLLSSLGLSSLGHIFSTWWPLILIAIGVTNLLGSPRQYIWPLFIITVGVLFQLRALEVITINVWGTIWPLAIVAFGLTFLFRPGAPGASFRNADDDHTNALALFSGQKVRSTSSNYQGGQLTALFGGIELDLRSAKIKDHARIDAVTAFGGAEIRVPEDVTVRVNGLPLFGGWDNKTTAPTHSGPVLEISGVVIFGGFEVKN